MTLVVLALAAPEVASAKSPVLLAPPGNSAVTQYAEVVPSDLGATPPRAGGGGPDQLSARQRRQLDGLGPAGHALVAVVVGTAPQATARPPAGVANPGAAQGGGSVGSTRGADTGRVPLSAAGWTSPGRLLLSAAGGGGGLGIVLGLVALGGGLAAMRSAVRRRRTQG